MTDNGSKKLLLIGWDGADWEHITPMLEKGLLPNLQAFMEAGTSGNLATLGPVLSPMLWNSVATGKYAYKHGIYGFTEPDRTNGGARPFTSYSRSTKAIWNIFSQLGMKTNVINWWASHPAEPIDGCVVSNLFAGVKPGTDGPIVPEGVVHPPELAKHLGRFKVFPQELTSEQICAFIPEAARVNQEEDSRVETFAKVFTETLTTHAVATAVMENEPWDVMAIYYTCHDHFCHAFMPFHPPRLPWVPEEDFEIYKDVITGAYRFSDMMLGRLLQLSGPDTTVMICSDHGFESGPLRTIGNPREPAGPAADHRQYGIFLAKGPNIRAGERVYGASLIDIAPTMLASLGIAIGEDMDGRPLLEIFRDAPAVETIPTWDEVEGPNPDGVHGEEKPLDPEEAAELLNQFVALGYIDDPGADKDKQFESAEIECDYNLAQNYIFASRPQDAIPLLERLVKRSPWEDRFIQQLVQAYQRSGRIRDALSLIERAYDLENTEAVAMKVVYAELKLATKTPFDNVEPVLRRASGLKAATPQLINRIAALYAAARRWNEARSLYQRSLELDHDNARAHQGLSRVYLRTGENQKSIDHALSAVELLFRLPHAHLNLGIALARTGHPEQAEQALQNALMISPGFVRAHRTLARLYKNRLKNPERAAQHEVLAQQHSGVRGFEQRISIRAATSRASEAPAAELPNLPSERERIALLRAERPTRVDERKPSGKQFVLVSGLPRSGTSLMMQMLEAGGLPPKTDGERIADEDNPKGYYEWEAIKRIATDRTLLDEDGLEQHAIKVISMLLKQMPYQHAYKIVFMTRPIEEVAASQARMIEHRGTDGADQTEAELAKNLATHRADVISWMESNPRVEFMQVDYPTLVAAPDRVLPRLTEFLGDAIPEPEAMRGVIDQRLYRNRTRQ
jgi:predicted AlkP superfamily phosphohydrolase/phosphomutase/tetratricopeptide (TPR) repeat protein